LIEHGRTTEPNLVTLTDTLVDDNGAITLDDRNDTVEDKEEDEDGEEEEEVEEEEGGGVDRGSEDDGDDELDEEGTGAGGVAGELNGDAPPPTGLSGEGRGVGSVGPAVDDRDRGNRGAWGVGLKGTGGDEPAVLLVALWPDARGKRNKPQYTRQRRQRNNKKRWRDEATVITTACCMINIAEWGEERTGEGEEGERRLKRVYTGNERINEEKED
jgi:hypothetical protein